MSNNHAVLLRLTQEEKTAIQEAAGDVSLNAWLRKVLRNHLGLGPIPKQQAIKIKRRSQVGLCTYCNAVTLELRTCLTCQAEGRIVGRHWKHRSDETSKWCDVCDCGYGHFKRRTEAICEVCKEWKTVKRIQNNKTDGITVTLLSRAEPTKATEVPVEPGYVLDVPDEFRASAVSAKTAVRIDFRDDGLVEVS